MTIGIFLLALGATARITRLITEDYLTRHLRAFFIRRLGPDNDISYLLSCPWCFGMYAAGGIFTLAWFYGTHPGFIIPAAALTASYLVGAAATLLGAEEDDDA